MLMTSRPKPVALSAGCHRSFADLGLQSGIYKLPTCKEAVLSKEGENQNLLTKGEQLSAMMDGRKLQEPAVC